MIDHHKHEWKEAAILKKVFPVRIDSVKFFVCKTCLDVREEVLYRVRHDKKQ